MKTIPANIHEAQILVNMVADFDYVGMHSIISMLIDTCAAKYNDNPVQIASTIYDAVRTINRDLGAYHL